MPMNKKEKMKAIKEGGLLNVHPAKQVLLECSACGIYRHPVCMNGFHSVNMVTKSLTYPWQCEDCKLCTICKVDADDLDVDGEEDITLLMCDLCDRGYHLNCLSPKLDEAPDGNPLFIALFVLCRDFFFKVQVGGASVLFLKLIPIPSLPPPIKSSVYSRILALPTLLCMSLLSVH